MTETMNKPIIRSETKVLDTPPSDFLDVSEVTPVHTSPDEANNRLGDRIGSKINDGVDGMSERETKTRSLARNIGAIMVKPLVRLGEKTAGIADSMNDKLSEFAHVTVDNAALKRERRENRTTAREWVRGLGEIRQATTGKRGSERAIFGKGLVDLENAGKHSSRYKSVTAALERAETRAHERKIRKGEQYSSKGMEIDQQNIMDRYDTETTRIDQSAESKNARLSNRGKRAVRREAKIDTIKSSVLGASKRVGAQTGSALKSATAQVEATKTRASQTREAVGGRLIQAKEAASSKSRENAELARQIVARKLYERAEKQFAKADGAESRGLTRAADRSLNRATKTESRANRVARVRR